MKPPAQPSSTNPHAAARLIAAHQAGVWRYLRVLGCGSAEADDLTQETFLRFLRQTFREESVPATAAYLRKTALNLFIDRRTRENRMQVMPHVEELDAAWTNWAGNDSGEELLDALRQCLGELTDRAQEALRLQFHDGASRAQIAVAMQLTEDGAKNLIQRAKQKLRDCITNKMS